MQEVKSLTLNAAKSKLKVKSAHFEQISKYGMACPYDVIQVK